MTKEKICLASDNFSEAHPLALEALTHANKGFAHAYGGDPWTVEAEQAICQALGAKAKVLIVPTGTGANILALQLACKKHESVICAETAHINTQESGAAEALVGCKLVTIPHRDGKVFPQDIVSRLRGERALGKHATSPRLLSITQTTEVGSVYTLEELTALSALCKQERLLLHIDGSRLYNAAAYLNVSLDKIIQAASCDLLSLGGTKNGLVQAEALVILNPALHDGADHLHKQNLQLISKMRYLSAQYIPFFKNNLWRTLAAHANEKAQALGAIIQTTPHLSLSYPVQTNQIFFTAPPSWIPLIQEKILCYVWNQEKNELRWITSWNTSDHDVKSVEKILAEISQRPPV